MQVDCKGASIRKMQKEASIPDDGSLEYGTHYLHPEFMKIYEESLASARMEDNVWRRPRFFHLTQLLGLTRSVVGATVEAGCFRGLSSLLICRYLQRDRSSYQGESHWMVDSFEGLSEPVDVDGTISTERFEEKAFTSTSVKHVRETMADFPKTTIVKGWIPDVFTQLPEQKYRFVHVDVDVYEPTLASFRYFYPRLSPGGIMVCDDFGPWPNGNWPGCAAAVREFANEFNVNFAALDTGNVFLIK